MIKSAIKPDEQADQAKHEFVYSLLPHAGEWRDGQLVPEAYALNYPLLNGYLPGGHPGSLPQTYRLAGGDAGNVIVENVKQTGQEGGRRVETQGSSLQFPILPYEIKTFKVWF